jgi:hypothetical protein
MEEVFAFIIMNYQEWRNQIKPDKKLRTYQHIDDSLNLDDDKVFQKVIRVLEDIKNHQFLPFVKRTETKIRFRKNRDGEARRSKKSRPIMYASHIDAHIYSYYNFLLMKKYEDYLKKLDISANIIAYRKIKIEETDKGKSNIHFAKEVFDYIHSQNECAVITHDIDGFFDNLNHGLLKEKICKINETEKLDDSLYKVFRSLTAHKYIEYDDFVGKKIKRKTQSNKYAIYKTLKGIVKENKTNKGIPQGSPISGLLANIYLVDFDNQIKISFPDVFYRRYSDDLVFVCNKEQKEELLKFIDEKINESKLTINSGKSYISYFKKDTDGVSCKEVTNGLGKKIGRNYVDYLGLEFNGEKIFLRKNTVQKLKHKQEKKAWKQLSNTQSQTRRKPKIIKNITNKTNKNRNNYFKRSLEIIDNIGIKKQVLRITQKRNKIKQNKDKSPN